MSSLATKGARSYALSITHSIWTSTAAHCSLPQRPLIPTSPTRKQQLTFQPLFHCSTIAGKKILNEYIALGVFGMTGFGAWAATRGGDAKATKIAESTSAKLNSSSEEEAAFIQNFINDLEHQDKAQNKH
ncbi:BQ5605_C005g03358 [Microbotryum silenes-dioicae]|uniref:BQ5605_C005g03358 protein n=1 Tax=Microbotryum silenes-dioicae TaxID=796604 RepID=A0A2X0PCB9_9BASI|nr:BQ5605_C005g03358 [Microbotryum silenes-dioicae]